MSPIPLDRKLKYNFMGEKVKIEMDNIEETFNFTDVPNGILNIEDIDTQLNPFPIEKAEKKNGVLYLTLTSFIPENARYKDRFPEWIDAKSYEQPKEETVDGYE